MKYVVTLIFIVACPFILKGISVLADWIVSRLSTKAIVFLLYPMFFWGMSKLLQYSELTAENDTIGFIPSMFLILIIFAAFTLVYLGEKSGKFISKKSSFLMFLLYIFLVLLSLVLNFAVQYDIMFDFYPDAYKNIVVECWYQSIAEFMFYSFGLITGNGISEIVPVTFVAKLLSSLEVLCSFVFLVIMLANYKEIGKLFSSDKREDNSSNNPLP